MGFRLEQQGKNLRRMILDKARDLLVTEGYTGLSMRKIAREIGYSPTSIYLHFLSKDALFFDLVDEGMSLLINSCESELKNSSEHPDKQLETICRAYFEFALSNPEYYEIMFLLHSKRMGRFPDTRYRQARAGLHLISEILKKGSEQGVFEIEDFYLTANTIWATLHGASSVLIAERLDVKINRELFEKGVITQILRGVCSPGEKEFFSEDLKALSMRRKDGQKDNYRT